MIVILRQQLIWLLFLLTTLAGTAQQKIASPSDALKIQRQLKKLSDKSAIEPNIALGKYYMSLADTTINLTKAKAFLNKALQSAKKYNEIQQTGNACLALSLAEQIEKHYTSGKTYAYQAVKAYTLTKDYNQLGEAFVMIWSLNTLDGADFQIRLDLLLKAEKIFRLAGNKKRQGDCLKEAADIYQINDQLDEAMDCLKKTLKLYQEIKQKELYEVYDLLGNVMLNLGDYEESMRFGLLAVRNAESTATNRLSLCSIYNHLAISYMAFEDYEKASLNYDKALKIAIEEEHKESILLICYNKSELYMRCKRYRKALAMFTIIKKYAESKDSPDPYAECLLLKIYTCLGDFAKAKQQFIKVAKIIEEDKAEKIVLSNAYNSIIGYSFATRQYPVAKKYISLFNKIQIGNLQTKHPVQLYYQFRLDSVEGNWTEAIRNYQLYKKESDYLFDEKKSLQINRMNILYETEKKNHDIQQLKNQSQQQLNKLEKEKIIRKIFYGGTIALFIFLMLLYYSFILKKRTNKILEAKQAEINNQNLRLQHLLDEKEWLLREIHHRVKNNLHMVVGLLESQTEFLKSSEALEAITHSQQRVQAMSLIHQKLYQSNNLSMTEMSSYICELIDYLEESSDGKYRITFRLEIEKMDFPLSHSIPIGLILNEAITNAMKYAFNSDDDAQILIALRPNSGQQCLLVIRDNGKGLPDDFNITESSSLGLRLIQGLTQDIKGDLKIYNEGGTVIEIEFPFPENNH
ncbi:tetratricopeptide repeat-containing sensor histidine kinase [Flavobacterium hauense]